MSHHKLVKTDVNTGETEVIPMTEEFVPNYLYGLYHNRAGELCALLYGYCRDLDNYYMAYNTEKLCSELICHSGDRSYPAVAKDKLYIDSYESNVTYYEFFPNDNAIAFAVPSSYYLYYTFIEDDYVFLVTEMPQEHPEYTNDEIDEYYNGKGIYLGPCSLSISVYDLNDATPIAQTLMTVNGYAGLNRDPYIGEDGELYFSIPCYDPGTEEFSQTDTFYKWDFKNAEVSVNDLRFLMSFKPAEDNRAVRYDLYWCENTFEDVAPGEVLETLKDLKERADLIGKKYDVSVLMSNEVKGIEGGYMVDAENDRAAIIAALDDLETALSKYPEGFFSQFKGDNYYYENGIEFYLAGTLSGRQDNTLGIAGGFKSTGSDAIKIYIDISSYGIEATVHHELSHVIDSFVSDKGFWSFDEEWNKYNPSLDGYYDAYTRSYDQWGYSDFTAYVLYWTDTKKNVYFIDSYSMTYPTEDRARIFENVMRENADINFSSYPKLKDKLNFYATAIRDAFDTTGWPEKTAWEKYTE